MTDAEKVALYEPIIQSLARWMDPDAESWDDPEEQMNEIPGQVEWARDVLKKAGVEWEQVGMKHADKDSAKSNTSSASEKI